MLNLLAEDGFEFEKVSSGKGGVYKGKCPICFGTDRFTVYPNDKYNGSFVCNVCDFRGDKIKYLREYRGLSYPDACNLLGIAMKIKNETTADLLKKLKPERHEPQSIPQPPKQWIDKTTALHHAFYRNMLSAPGKKYRDYLQTEKFLTIKTIQKARLGFNPSGMKFSRESFGLTPDPEKNTTWIAAGIVIPYFFDEQNDKLIRLRVRQENPDPRFGRYLMSTGSSSTFLIYPGSEDMLKPLLIVEAELDGWLLWQEAGDLINVMASGSSNNYPCINSDFLIQNSSQVFVWGDNDKAGLKMNKWWEKQYSAIPIIQTIGEDVSNARSEGLNIREFIIEQIKGEKPHQGNSQENNTENSQEIEDIKIPERVVVTDKKITEKTQEILEQNSHEKITGDSHENKDQVSLDEQVLKKVENRHCFGNLCGSLKNNTCLVDKKDIFDIEVCPNGIWYKYKDSDDIETIIRSPSLKRDRKY